MPFDPSAFALLKQSDCRPEAAALIAILRDHFAPEADLPLPDGPAACLILRELARLNKVSGFLAPHRDALAARDATLARWLDQVRLATIAMNRRNLSLGVQVSQVLIAQGLAHVHFKGPMQQMQLYGSPDMKPAADIDILLARRDIPRAATLLATLGYRAKHDRTGDWSFRFLGEQHFCREDRDPVIDLHFRLQQPGSPAPRAMLETLDRAQWLEVGSARVPIMGASDRCLIAAISVVKALFGREPCAGYVMDFRAATRDLSADEARTLPALARHHRLVETLALAQRAAAVLLGPDGPVARGMALPEIDDPTLVAMLVTPWDDRINWLRRRSLLWSLCGTHPGRFAVETARLLASEGYRRARMLAN